MEHPSLTARNSLANPLAIFRTSHVIPPQLHTGCSTNFYFCPAILFISLMAVSCCITSNFKARSIDCYALHSITPGHPGLHSDVSVASIVQESDTSVAQVSFASDCSFQQATRFLPLTVAGKMQGLLFTAKHSEVNTIISRIPTSFSFVCKTTYLSVIFSLQLKR